jgi:hypothetical protein
MLYYYENEPFKYVTDLNKEKSQGQNYFQQNTTLFSMK